MPSEGWGKKWLLVEVLRNSRKHKPAGRSVPFKAWTNCKERFSTVPDELTEGNFAGIPPLLGKARTKTFDENASVSRKIGNH